MIVGFIKQIMFVACVTLVSLVFKLVRRDITEIQFKAVKIEFTPWYKKLIDMNVPSILKEVKYVDSCK